MSNVLVINSSAALAGSVSKLLVDDVVAKLRLRDPQLHVVSRDLGHAPVPHLTPDAAAGMRSPEPANDAQRAAQTLSNTLIAELQAADTIILGVPMYNFGMPSTLKAWFDYVLRAGFTFRYGPAGPEGLVTGKRAIVVLSRGGLYTEGPFMPMDSQEPHLRNLLGFMGIKDVTFIRAERLAYGPEMRDQAIGAAQGEIGRWVETAYAQAA
jgi:FMN-dependent NADH-azoreductase